MANAQQILEELQRAPSESIDELLTEVQPRPTLLDPILPRSLTLLTDHFTDTRNYEALRTIYAFTRIRGYKQVLHHLPAEVSLFSFVLDSLTSTAPEDWKAQFVLLLWLASLVIVPFELDALHVGLFKRLQVCSRSYLHKSGVQRDAAALLMARILTRSTSRASKLMDEFDKGFTTEDPESPAAIGKLQVFAHAMNRVSRVPTCVERRIQEAEANSAETETSSTNRGSSYSTRLWIKIFGRAALIDPDQFGPFAVSECIAYYDDDSSQVRLAAAKYTARLVRRLGPGAAEEVCESLLESLRHEKIQHASASYWSGSMLAIAEIVRVAASSDIANDILSQLVEEVLLHKGLHFIQEGTKVNTGSNVRDAACYAAWSLFRSKLAIRQSTRIKLYSSLLALATLDNEVNVRRAASAALQEGLGRYGSSAGDITSSEMFKIIESVNFNSVSSIEHCYLNLLISFHSSMNSFPHLFSSHGINSADPDIRRLASKSAILLNDARKHEIVDFILDQDLRPNPHGAMLTLGNILLHSSSDYRRDDALVFLRKYHSSDSDLLLEAKLILASKDYALVASLLNAISTENEFVTNAAGDVVVSLPDAFLKSCVIPLCSERMRHSHLFVTCLVRLYAQRKSLKAALDQLILDCTTLPNPSSRALAVFSLEIGDRESALRLLAALKDYSNDERGDVGSWVREAAILRIAKLGLKQFEQVDPDLLDEFISTLWHLASDSRQKTRILAGSALAQLDLVEAELPETIAAEYFASLLRQCPFKYRHAVSKGIASSVGAARASAATINGSFRGLLEFLDEAEENTWILREIMKLDRARLSTCYEVVKTLKRVLVSGTSLSTVLTQAMLAIAYNTTLNSRLPEPILMDSIDILQILGTPAQEDKATSRLQALMKRHRNGLVRQRAADALFEIGVSDKSIEDTDWTASSVLSQREKALSA